MKKSLANHDGRLRFRMTEKEMTSHDKEAP